MVAGIVGKVKDENLLPARRDDTHLYIGATGPQCRHWLPRLVFRHSIPTLEIVNVVWLRDSSTFVTRVLVYSMPLSVSTLDSNVVTNLYSQIETACTLNSLRYF